MVKQLGNRCAVVMSSELGVNCWHPHRFVKEGSRCDRIWSCNYPEKNRCEAIHAEIKAMREQQQRYLKLSSTLDMRIEELAGMTQK